MLSKIVCAECHRKQSEDEFHPRSSFSEWSSIDTEQWDELNTAICDMEFSSGPIIFKTCSTLMPPPDWCPNKFKHAVALGMEL